MIEKNNFQFSTLHFQLKKSGFTLAEVLITLGIIGVVSAITIPVLIGHYKEQTTITKLKKFYSVMAQAQLQSIAENGEVDTWDWVKQGEESNNAIVLAWFNKYLGNYLNKVEVIDKKILSDEGIERDDGIVVKFADGTIMNIIGFSGNYLHFQYYTNGKTFHNNTAQWGKDIFMFGFGRNTTTNPCVKRFNPYRCHFDLKELKNDTYAGCRPDVRNISAGCARLLQLNDWKVPKDYPFKF